MEMCIIIYRLFSVSASLLYMNIDTSVVVDIYFQNLLTARPFLFGFPFLFIFDFTVNKNTNTYHGNKHQYCYDK